MHAQIPGNLKCSVSSEEPEAAVQLKPFVMCHTALLTRTIVCFVM